MDPAPDPQPIPGPAPQPDIPLPLAIVAPGADEKKEKRDGFYKSWDRFTKKKRLLSIIPSLDHDPEGRPGHGVRRNTEGVVSRVNATTSFEQAKATCEAKVNAIIRECRRLNQKYYDRRFDLPDSDTLIGLNGTTPMSMNGLQGIGSVKRIEDIYEEPQFFVDGASANDVRQGSNGDCWFIAAITALSGKQDLLNRLCVARDEDVGVYGFVFFRDGEWISEVVDDRLALRQSDDSSNYQTEHLLRTLGDKNPLSTPLEQMSYGIWRLPKEFRDSLRKGSNALFFASCRDSNETWLPLMEKAYAKAHGDYQSIEGGYAGEGIEDLTGGVATYIKSEDVLDKEQLWRELMQVNDKFLFGCGSRRGRDNDPADEEGFVRGHAYTVLSAREIDKPKSLIAMEEKEAAKKGEIKKKKKGNNGKVRLLKLHNPWGKQEWNGAWSDGAKEWTAEVLETLDHTFGDDGLFWISYEDFLKYYPEIDRIRLFGDDWTVAQQWTAVTVPWTAEYLDTSFDVTITKAGPVVIVLSQPDDRYFLGLTGRYDYELHFRLYKEGEDVYLLRSMEDSGSNRSVKAEVDLDPGTYNVLVKVTASRDALAQTPEEVIKTYRDSRREKLLAIGNSFDLIHSKGRLREREQGSEKQKKKDEQEKEHKDLVEERQQRKKERLKDKLRARRIKAEEKRKRDEKMAEKKAELKAKREAKEAERKKRKAEKEEKKKAEEEEKKKAEEEEAKKAEEEKAKKTEDEEAKKPTAEEDKQAAEDEKKTTEEGNKNATEEKEDASKDKSEDTSASADTSETEKPSADTQEESATSESSVGQPTPSTSKSEDGEPKAKEQEVDTTAADTSKADSTEIDTPKADEKKVKDESTSTDEDKAEEASSKDDKKAEKDTKDDADDNEDSKGGENETDDKDKESCESESEPDADISEVSSVADDDFEWDDTMDGPVEDDSDESDSNADDMYADDPWNAACVIGLRICSMDKDASIKVVHGTRKKGLALIPST